MCTFYAGMCIFYLIIFFGAYPAIGTYSELSLFFICGQIFFVWVICTSSCGPLEASHTWLVVPAP